MNLNPLFSIVMANYNGAKYLEDAINSILNQSCQEFELIIVDGGSTDKSVDIIKKYENRLAWWVSEKDNGQSDAFNKGFAKAKGEFYFWVNADDLLLPKSLEHAKRAIEKNPVCKWFAANTIFFDKDGNIQKCSRGPIWNKTIFRNSPIVVAGSTSIFHKSIFFSVGGFDESLNYTMDTDIWMRFYNKGFEFKRIQKYFWGFRIHHDSKTSHAFQQKANEEFSRERKRIQSKNNHQYTMLGYYAQLILKFITGTIFLSLIDTIIYKNKKIYH